MEGKPVSFSEILTHIQAHRLSTLHKTGTFLWVLPSEPRNTCLWKQMDEKAFQQTLGEKPLITLGSTKKTYIFI